MPSRFEAGGSDVEMDLIRYILRLPEFFKEGGRRDAAECE